MRIAEAGEQLGDGLQPEAALRERERGEPVKLGLDLGGIGFGEIGHSIFSRLPLPVGRELGAGSCPPLTQSSRTAEDQALSMLRA